MPISSYLQKLRFDPKLSESAITKYFANPRLVMLLAILIIGMGLYSFFSLPRTLNPEIKIPIVIVSAVLPGAPPKDIEALLTIPLEDAVTGLSRVKQITSSSQDSVSVITLEFESGVDPDKARSDVQSAVDTVSGLPKDAKAPKVQKLDFSNQPIWTFSLTGNADTGSLMRYAKILQAKIKDLPSVDMVTTSGFEQQEIQIVLKPSAFATYSLNPFSLSAAITAALGSFPAGSVHTQTSSFALSIDPMVTTVDDIRNISVVLPNATVQLAEVADVAQVSKPDQSESFFASSKTLPRRALTFDVFKTNSVNIDKAYTDVQALLAKEEPLKKGQFTVSSVTNAAQEINDQYGELAKDFAITISLVFVVLFIFLGLRQAIVASITIPLTFFISFIVMGSTGISLSFISLFSLLLALGLLVDDAIVVVSAMTAYYRTGRFTPLQTGLLVWRDFLIPILTTTITTVWAFLPLLLSTGIIGEFIKPIPIVTSTTLIASFFVAMFITLPLIIVLLGKALPRRAVIVIRVLALLLIAVLLLALLPKGPMYVLEVLSATVFVFVFYHTRFFLKERIGRFVKRFSKRVNSKVLLQAADNGIIHFGIISNRYYAVIDKILASKRYRRMTIVMVIIFSIFSYLLVPFGFVKNEFFPKGNQDFVFMTLELPSGTNVKTAKSFAVSLLSDVRNTPELSFVTADVGRSFNPSGGVGQGQGNNVLFTFVLHPKHERRLTSGDIGEILRKKFANFSQGKVSVVESTGGPPAGADLQIKLFGSDLTVLDSYANKLEDFLKTKPGVVNVDKSIKSGTSKLVFLPDKQKMAETGLTQDIVGFWLRILASGSTADTIKLDAVGTDQTDITIRMDKNVITPEMIDSVTIPTQQGLASLSSLGSLRLESNPTLITREDGKRTVSVTAGVSQGYSVSQRNKELEEFAATLNLPAGYSWKTGGVNDENQKSVQSILVAMVLSFVLIISTMVVQFGSFRRAVIVILVIPLSISGVFVIFALTQTPLSFPALIGMLALFGIVVKNAILVVDKIVSNLKVGIAFRQAISDAASSRLEAIALTSFTAIIGLIPITLSDPLWRGLGGAIIAGLTFSGTIMLFFIPVVYYFWFVPTERKTVRKTSR